MRAVKKKLEELLAEGKGNAKTQTMLDMVNKLIKQVTSEKEKKEQN